MRISKSSQPMRRINLLLTVWSLVAVTSALAHFLLAAWTADGTNWPSSLHWQWEIACFDLFAAAVFLWAARQRHVDIKVKTATLLCCLSSALGINHLSGWIEKPQIFHVVFTIGNLLAVLWGISAIRRAKTQEGR